MIVAQHLHVAWPGFYGQISTILFARPIPIALLVAGAFYLWAYGRTATHDTYGSEATVAERHYSDGIPTSLRSVHLAHADEIIPDITPRQLTAPEKERAQ
jgi:hypothetical protein